MPITAEKWKRPPVIEVVAGVQFEPIKGLTNGRLGCFWRELRVDYPVATDAAPIERATESFGAEIEYQVPSIAFAAHTGSSRLRMTSADGNRMIQVQNGWLLVNWIQGMGGEYPGFDEVRAEFGKSLAAFRAFLKAEELGECVPNLWEVTYIDHIPRGTVWTDLADLFAVVPGLLGACTSPCGQLRGLDATFSFALTRYPGRLSIALQMARSRADPSKELLVMRSTARGPIIHTDQNSVLEALNTGQAAAVETFVSVTSGPAQAYWKG